MRERRRYRAVVVGASSGGVLALQRLLSGLDPAFRTPVIIVLHTTPADGGGLTEVLGQCSAIPVVEAGERQRITPARVYVAPPGYHLLIEKSQRFSLSVDEHVCYARPSVDVLFETAADVWRHALIGVVLTGANDDGANGLKTIRSARGLGVVQSPGEAESPEMPAAAVQRAGADYVLPVAKIGELLNRLCLAQPPPLQEAT